MGTALSFALTLVDIVPHIVRGVSGAVDAFNSGSEVLKRLVEEDRDPTPEEWDSLNSQVAALRQELHSD